MQLTIEHALSEMVAAWDAGDADAYARSFTEHATYVTFAGTVSRGRDAIRRDHVPVLEKYRKGSRMRVEVTAVTEVADDRVIVLTDGGIGTGPRIRLDKVQTFVFGRQPDGTWLCEAFHNTRKHRLMIWLAGRSAR